MLLFEATWVFYELKVIGVTSAAISCLVPEYTGITLLARTVAGSRNNNNTTRQLRGKPATAQAPVSLHLLDRITDSPISRRHRNTQRQTAGGRWSDTPTLPPCAVTVSTLPPPLTAPSTPSTVPITGVAARGWLCSARGPA